MLQVSLRQIDICYTGYAEQDQIRQISQLQVQYSTPSSADKIEIENTQIPILIFEEAKGRGWGRMLTNERDRTSNYSTTYETIFAKALSLFEQIFMQYNIYEPKQALYARRVRQLKTKNNHLKETLDLDMMTKQLKLYFNNILSTAHSLQQLDKTAKETQYEKSDRMKLNYKHYTQLAQLEIREEILNVNKKEQEKERNRLQW